jgi:hypothetical protein
VVAPAQASLLSTNVLTISGYPSPTTAGITQTLALTAYDPYGNVATDYTGTVHFTSSDAQAALPADYTFTAGDAGTHTFSAALKTAGAQSITAADTANAALTSTQSNLTVFAAAASAFVIGGLSTPVTAGAAETFTVTAYDPYGNIATGYTGTVHLTSSDGQAALPADYAFTAGDAGSHAFSAALKTAGAQSITATDTVDSTVTGLATGITVNPAAAVLFTVTGYPGSTTAGTASTFVVTAYDAYGNIATGYVGTVHLTSSDAQALLPADYTFTAADAGTHVFTTTLETVGTQSITVVDTTDATITGTQSGIIVQ